MERREDGAAEEPLPSGFEPFNHELPSRLRSATIASFFFYTGGQILKGHWGRALAFWVAFVVIIAGMVLISMQTEPASSARSVVLGGGLAAIFVLWLYHLWDAATRP